MYNNIFKTIKSLEKIDRIEDRYILHEKVNQCKDCKCYKSQHKIYFTKCSIKIIEKEHIKNCYSRSSKMLQELYILQNTLHEGVLGVYELLHDDSNFYIVSEFVGDADIRQHDLTA